MTPTVWAKVWTKALVVAQPQAWAVSVTVAPSASMTIAVKTRTRVRHWGKVRPNSSR